MLTKLKNSPKLAEMKASYPIINTFVIICAIIMLWRGVWGLLDMYLFPDSPAFSHLVSLLLGALVLYIDGFNIDNLKR